ncbi:MAG TPA: DUF190 domain-containing protein [Methylophaga aminisulfidivorans]|uniref:DUF190 domain-containing protein n=2 Tax=root TaxID=1 RepID=A0A7C1W5I5_9GAMM|nr:DUF190 domain-containing protein [Methylophaga aminisulfidivorans]
MSRIDVTIVRVYLSEGRDHTKRILKWLEQSEVKGFTAFRGIAGIGVAHELHTASLLDLSAELPIVIEFFDTPEQADKIISELESMVKPDRIVSWPAQSGK